MKPFYLETANLDPEKSGNPLGNFKFNVSYGDPQPVAGDREAKPRSGQR